MNKNILVMATRFQYNCSVYKSYNCAHVAYESGNRLYKSLIIAYVSKVRETIYNNTLKMYWLH